MRPILTAFCVLGLAACGRGDKAQSATADSLSRDLQLAQQDSTNPMADTAATPAAAPAPAPAPAPTPAPVTPTPKPADGDGRPPSRNCCTIPAISAMMASGPPATSVGCLSRW